MKNLYYALVSMDPMELSPDQGLNAKVVTSFIYRDAEGDMKRYNVPVILAETKDDASFFAEVEQRLR